jgi:ribonucleoside-diphosphate reductase alpha chain
VSVKEKEWVDVAAWVYKNFEHLSGLSFLPDDGGVYQQAPYKEVSKEEYEKRLAQMPTDIDWTGLRYFESEDTTTGTRELACVAGACELP